MKKKQKELRTTDYLTKYREEQNENPYRGR